MKRIIIILLFCMMLSSCNLSNISQNSDSTPDTSLIALNYYKQDEINALINWIDYSAYSKDNKETVINIVIDTQNSLANLLSASDVDLAIEQAKQQIKEIPRMPISYLVYGTIVDSKGNVVNKVTINLLDLNLNLIEGIDVDSLGEYAFSNVSGGDYYIMIVNQVADLYSAHPNILVNVTGDNSSFVLDDIILERSTISWGQLK